MTGQSQATENPGGILNGSLLTVEFPRFTGKPVWNARALLKWPGRGGFDCESDWLGPIPVIYALDAYRLGQCRKTAEGRKNPSLRQARTCAATAALLCPDAGGSHAFACLADQDPFDAHVADQKTLFADFIEHLPLGLCQVGKDGKVLMSNPAYRHFLPESPVPSLVAPESGALSRSGRCRLPVRAG